MSQKAVFLDADGGLNIAILRNGKPVGCQTIGIDRKYPNDKKININADYRTLTLTKEANWILTK